MPGNQPITVRTLGLLHVHRRERGLPTTVQVSVPDGGRPASEIAAALDLPLAMIEGLFLNHVCTHLDAVVMPGDRVAFVPYGTPASHPAFFGRFDKLRAG